MSKGMFGTIVLVIFMFCVWLLHEDTKGLRPHKVKESITYCKEHDFNYEITEIGNGNFYIDCKLKEQTK